MNTPKFSELSRIFGRIGVLSFGGPAAQIALMHQELVEKRDWLTEQTYLRALSLCMLLPGPEAMQLATYAGWRLRGVAGGLLAGLLFVLPGALVIAVLALLYARFGDMPQVQAAFLGIKACVVIVVFQALQKIAQKALDGNVGWALATASFVGIFALGVPFPLIILGAALVGWLRPADGTGTTETTPNQARPNTLRTFTIWGLIWAIPLALLYAFDQQFLLELGLFFSKLAVVTFGGAYAVLAYMTQSIVQDYGWITTDQMIDALGLAETTPGPLILVTEFVALLAGHAQSGTGGAIAAGVVALWVTFTPCFLWIFVAGPYLDWISNQPRIAAALKAITAAVVGVIANLSVWFTLHLLFDRVEPPKWGALPLPDLSSFNVIAALLTLVAAALIGWAKIGFVPAMGLLAALAFGIHLI